MIRRAPVCAATALAVLLSLSACTDSEDTAQPKQQAQPKAAKSEPLPEFEADETGTAMEERVATLGLLNKRTGESRDIELKPGQELRAGKVIIRLRACERTKPWETFPDEGAFVQINVLQRPNGTNDDPRWERVHSGWLFKENPAANVVQHPVYDVWVKSCMMRFPGEENPPANPPSKTPSSAPQSPDDAPADDAAEAEPVADT